MSGGYQNLAGRVESGQEVFGISWDGSGRAGSGRVEISRVVWSQVRRCLEIMERVGSGRVRRFSNLAGRAGLS